ncbi:MAG: hypothetical protein WD749_00580 [Phycisphaerales bacterium]
MSLPLKPNSLQSYQVILYNRALHPELFSLKGRKVIRHGNYEFEIWAMAGAHLLRFEKAALCACELVIGEDGKMPQAGIVTAFLCAGERDFEHRFEKDKVVYMTTVQTETLSENLYISTYDEMMDYARENDALVHRWQDEAGECLTVIDAQRYNREIHAQAYHLIAQGGIVLRTQTIFEHA